MIYEAFDVTYNIYITKQWWELIFDSVLMIYQYPVHQSNSFRIYRRLLNNSWKPDIFFFCVVYLT